MTDLEMTKLCAEAIGEYELWANAPEQYDPLHDDAQAMALVKKFQLCLTIMEDGTWMVEHVTNKRFDSTSRDTDINRAIVECVAMQAAT
jgi:hypothetical protein